MAKAAAYSKTYASGSGSGASSRSVYDAQVHWFQALLDEDTCGDLAAMNFGNQDERYKAAQKSCVFDSLTGPGAQLDALRQKRPEVHVAQGGHHCLPHKAHLPHVNASGKRLQNVSGPQCDKGAGARPNERQGAPRGSRARHERLEKEP